MRNKFPKANFLISLVSLLIPFTTAFPVSAQSARLVGEVQQARSMEASGNYRSAGEAYYGILENDCIERNDPTASRGFQAALGRRAVACLTVAARQEMQHEDPGGGWEHSEALNMLMNCWRVMSKLEPNNPVWEYLMATRACSEGRYVEARRSLQAALRTTGGQASVRQKAKSLLSHIGRYADNDQAKMIAEDRAAVQYLLSGQMARDFGHVTSSSSSSSSPSSYQPEGISDSERRARDAEAAGDSGAASRFRSGGTTIQDSSRYW